jgi:hypothetical protein
MLLPPLQLCITVTASLCITGAQCRQSTNFANGPQIYILSIVKLLKARNIRIRSAFAVYLGKEQTHINRLGYQLVKKWIGLN